MRSGVSFGCVLGGAAWFGQALLFGARVGVWQGANLLHPMALRTCPSRLFMGKQPSLCLFFGGGRCVDLGIWFPKIGCEGVGGWAESLLKPHEQNM